MTSMSRAWKTVATVLSILLACVAISHFEYLLRTTFKSNRAEAINAPSSCSSDSSGSTAPSISVCIPAIPRDIDSGCLHELMHSIRRQSARAAEIVISMSNATYSQARHARTIAQESVAQVPVRVLRSSDISVQGMSRNNAALLSDADIISFIDADDKMHPHRIQAIQETFRERADLQVLLHGYTDREEFDWESTSLLAPSGYAVVEKEEICKSELRTRHQPHLDIFVHHAHVTVKRSIFKEFSYDESPEAYRKEDSLFVRDVVAAACSRQNVSDLLFLEAPLSFYRSKRVPCDRIEKDR